MVRHRVGLDQESADKLGCCKRTLKESDKYHRSALNLQRGAKRPQGTRHDATTY